MGDELGEQAGLAKIPRVYQFGEFQIDTVEESLHRSGEKLSINRRTFQVLRLLVMRAGEIVSKQDFFDTVWAGTFVEDNSLTVAITTLRKLLGDDARNATFIENLPRKGYRFIGKVTCVDDQPTPAQTEQLVPQSPAGRKTIFRNRKILVGAFAACLLLLLAVLGFSYFGNDDSSADSNQIESIAVLPFQNQDPEFEYLSDGLTESIINKLAELPNLRVISRNSVFQYKNKVTDPTIIGRDLNVRALLSGRFVQRGDDLIVDIEMTDLRNNRQLWGKQYSHKASDAFALQQEISRDITETLRSKLMGEAQQRLTKRETDNSEAFLLYLKGRYHWNKRTNEGFEKAVDFYKQAIEQDPTYALAYVGLANCYLNLTFKHAVTTAERAGMVKAAAQQALEIDPQLGEVYATLAINSHFNEWDWANADRQYKLALELSPNYATAHHWYAEFLATEGRFDESFAEYKRALELDPLSLAISTDLGLNYYHARQPDRAIEHLKKLKEIDPNYMRTPVFLGLVYQEKGMYEEAIAEEHKVNTILGENLEKWAVRKAALETAFRTAGPKGYWQKAVELSLAEENPNSWLLVNYYAKLGDRDKGFEYMEKLYQGRSPVLVWLKVSPAFDGLRSDPRFADFMRRVGVPH